LGVEKLDSFLRRHRRVALDTSVFIYHIQTNPKYLALTDFLFTWLEKSRGSAITSNVTMTEVLVQPIRAGDEKLVGEFFALLTRYPNLEWVPVSMQIAALAARYRAAHSLRTPDALQAATSVYSSVSALVTNDPVFKRISELHVLVLDDLL
jgi:predicted nucleic acid-binding protein